MKNFKIAPRNAIRTIDPPKSVSGTTVILGSKYPKLQYALSRIASRITIFSSLTVKEVTKINNCVISSVVGNLFSARSQVWVVIIKQEAKRK